VKFLLEAKTMCRPPQHLNLTPPIYADLDKNSAQATKPKHSQISSNQITLNYTGSNFCSCSCIMTSQVITNCLIFYTKSFKEGGARTFCHYANKDDT